ncbi:MAG: hypothetical protein PHP42_02295 [Bacteroidota bacterium]|nr:hypothetical protein [Bacteroidota bacterium]
MILYRAMMFQKYICKRERIISIKNILLCSCPILFAFLLISCEQNVTIEIKTNDKRLLVDGEFTSDTVVHSIRLYSAGSLITGKPQTVVSGAKIYVTDGIVTYEYIERKDTLGLYQTAGSVGGKGGRNYTLSITNIDIDNDGTMDSYTAQSFMPVPVKFDSLVSKRGLNGDGNMAVNNYAYYKLYYNGPGYVYPFVLVNNNYTRYGTIIDKLGTGEINRSENQYKVLKILSPDSVISCWAYCSLPPKEGKNSDTISFICYNFTTEQFEFLKEFDNNTNSKEPFIDNMYDQLKIPANLPTNIEPADKAAGYFFVYSVSKISKVFNE